jgi:hypothetical protein
MTSSCASLSGGLNALLRDLAYFATAGDDDTFEIEGADARKLHHIIETMRDMAIHQEIELRCLRAAEAGQAVATATSGALDEVLSGVDSKIIRPDFGGRS